MLAPDSFRASYRRRTQLLTSRLGRHSVWGLNIGRLTGLVHALLVAVFICAVLEVSSDHDGVRNQADSTPHATLAAAKNKQIAKQFYAMLDAIAAGRANATAFDQIAATDFRAHLPGRDAIDREGFKGIMRSFAVGFPGAKYDLEDLIAEGDRVVARVTWRGNHSDMLQGTPSARRDIELSAMGVLRIVDGKIAEFWAVFDLMALTSGSDIIATAIAAR